MFENFNEEARRVLVEARKEVLELHHPFVGSEHLLLGILKCSDASKRLKEYGITYENFKNELINIIGIGNEKTSRFLYTPLLKRVIITATEDAKELNSSITVENLLSALLEEGEGVAIRTLLAMNIDLEKICDEYIYKVVSVKNNNSSVINELGVDLTRKAKEGMLDPVIGRDNEIKRVIEILTRRSKNNPLLLGEAGVGKTAIVEGLSYLIANNMVPKNLKNKRIINVDMASLVAGTKYRGEFEERVRKIIDEVSDSDIILFIDEIHTLVGAGGAEGAIDASNIFKPALARGNIRVIGATTEEEYKRTIAQDKALSRRFQNITIKIPDKTVTKKILMGIKPIYEKYHNVIIHDEIIDLIIELSDKYIHNRYEPDKSVDILDEVSAYVSLKETKNIKNYKKISTKLNEVRNIKNKFLMNDDYKNALIYREDEKELLSKINIIEQNMSKSKRQEVSKKDVAYIFNMKTGIPIYELLNETKDISKILKNFKKDIVGQTKVCNKCIDIIKRVKLGLLDKCYSMLFLGPTGVGKTLVASTFSSVLTKDNLIKLNGCEYTDSSSISKIIGSPYNIDIVSFLDEIKNKPFSVILIEDVQTFHPDILNLFYQILENGKIKNYKGEYVYFNNSIIIMTSNFGFNKTMGFNSCEKVNLNDILPLEFINLIDSTLYFDKLNENDIRLIINKKINDIRKKYKEKSINVKIADSVIEDIINKCEYNTLGAKKVNKIIKEELESIIVNNIINNKKNIVISSTVDVLV